MSNSEDMLRASHNMQGAADTFYRAVGALEGVLSQHQQYMTEWLDRLEKVLQEKGDKT